MHVFPSSGSTAVSLPQRLTQAVVAGLGLQAIYNGVATEAARHGGGYQTEAGHAFRASVLPRLIRCIDQVGASSLPPERLMAHCLSNGAATVCRDSSDLGCATVARRGLMNDDTRLAAGLKPNVPLDVVVGEIRQRFSHSGPFEQAMDALAEAVAERIIDGGESYEVPYTRENLRALLEENNEKFFSALLKQGAELNQAARTIAGRVFVLQPEWLDEARLERFSSWLDKQYPSSAATVLSTRQLDRVLGDLAAYMNKNHRSGG